MSGRIASAEAEAAMSLEWLTTCAASIGIAEVVEVNPENTSEAKFTKIFIATRSKKALKGKPPASAAFTRMWMTSARRGEPQSRPERGDQYLLMFDDRETLVRATELSAPARSGEGVALSADFKLLVSRQEILKAVARQLAHRKPIKHRCACQSAMDAATKAEGFRRVVVPPDSEAGQALASGQTAYLIVP